MTQVFSCRLECVTFINSECPDAGTMYKDFGQAHAAIKFAKITSFIDRNKPIKIFVNAELVFEGMIWPDLRRPFPSNFRIPTNWMGKYEKKENMWKQKLVELDPQKWPTIDVVPHVSIQELKTMYRFHPSRMSLARCEEEEHESKLM